MASFLRQFTSSAVPPIPSSTSSAFVDIPIPSFIISNSKSATWFYTTAAIVGTLLVLEHLHDSMKPTMEGYMRQWNSGALSAISVFNIFIVMASSNEFSRKILNSPAHAEPCLVHSAKQILMPDNWVFLTGKSHVEYRKVLNTLFTRKALRTAIARKHFSLWLADAQKDPSPQSIMMTARHLNMITSLRVFCGNHIPEHGAVEISEKYWDITQALELVNFPLALPGTKVYRAIQARKAAIKWLELAARLEAPGYKGRKDFSDREMAMVVFSFLFASQDAMSSGTAVRAGDVDKPITLEMLDQMPYLKAFVKESMRVKPPVTMVPYRTTKAFPISNDYIVPANSMVIPSFYNSLHDPAVFPEHDKLIPDRWLDPNSSANTNPRNYLVFGSGPHKCVGIEYATMNIGLVLATASVLMDWEHHITPESDQVQIIATLFPKDGCLMKFTPRPRP
ncbi:cytochrome P450 [Suillus lakei]|nr:cytochrome P450 [Suillus lakei]